MIYNLLFLLLQPSEIAWKKLNQKGVQGIEDSIPGGRSGHTLTFVGGYNYMLYGGIEAQKKEGQPIKSNSDVWFMKLAPSKYLTFSFS